ncbi:MAG TPA: hypothetical protein VES38_03210, partial [Methylotenera sp.]|nr:hypothetical protein [Methylotenera sp.]
YRNCTNGTAMNTLKSPTIFVGLLIVSSLAHLFLAEVQAAPNDNLGRLFSRPNERNNLDFLRQNQKLKIIIPQAEPQLDSTADIVEAELPAPITLQGYVKRSDGAKSTLWINNQAVQEDSMVDSVQIGKLNQRGHSNLGGSPEGLDVKIPANGKQLRLKAGQVYEPETNEIKELKTVEKEKQIYLQETGVIGEEQYLP